MTDVFRLGLMIAGPLAVLAAPLSFISRWGPHLRPRPACRIYCAVDGPPVQPDPEPLPHCGLTRAAGATR